MLRRIIAVLTLLCLLALPALADPYDDHGWPMDWRDHDYPGFYVDIHQEPMQIKLPKGWTEDGYSGSVAAYSSADGRMGMTISWISDEMGDYMSRVEDDPDFQYWMFVLLESDIPCMVGLMDGYLYCVCASPDYESTLIFSFELTNLGADLDLARHMIGSIRYR